MARYLTGLASLAIALAAIVAPATLAQPGTPAGGTVTMEYLGWSHFRFTSVNGKVILTNPWITYPGSTVSLDDIPKADLILVPNAHLDEVGETIQIAQKTGAKIVAPPELNFWFMDVGIPPAQIASTFMSPGDRLDWEGITIRMVNSVHSSGINTPPGPTAAVPYGGPAVGYYITFENGWTVYFAGSSAATMDQSLWAQMYKPHAAILGLDGGREPMDFAMMVKLTSTDNPNLVDVFPHHHFPAFPGQKPSVADAQAAVTAMGINLTVRDQAVRQVFRFTR
jgi:L-ascorbate metabolism protein UlaG (beta-lactamase superfamily)